MADPTNVRVRRSRAHAKGDHSLCKPERCENAPGREPAPKAPDKTGADRVRRHRRHSQGDHSLCLMGNCSAVTPVSVTDDVTAEIVSTQGEPASAEDGPDGLAGRGRRLWDAMTAAWTPGPLHREMLLEACRMADRLEKLDRQLKGEDWLRFWARNQDGTRIDVIVDKVLAEARELAAQFRQTAEVLVKAAGAVKPAKGGGKLASVRALAPVAASPR
jgi:hypothetical protein